MKSNKIIFFRTDRETNDALVSFLYRHEVASVNRYSFSSRDVKNHEVVYEGMTEREWDGWMFGIKVVTLTGETIVFASWDDECEINPVQAERQPEYRENESAFISALQALASFN